MLLLKNYRQFHKLGMTLSTLGVFTIILALSGIYFNQMYASSQTYAGDDIDITNVPNFENAVTNTFKDPDVPESETDPVVSSDPADQKDSQAPTLTERIDEDTVKSTPTMDQSKKTNNNVLSSSGKKRSEQTSAVNSTQVDEQFAGSQLNPALWEIISYPKGYRNSEEQDYLPSQVRVADGTLQLIAARDAQGNWHSGEVHSKWLYRYGEFEVRLKISATAPGVFPAAWLLSGDDHWPNGGEIDIYESINTDPRIYGTAHGGGSSGHWLKQRSHASVDVTQYHTYKVVKTPGLIVFWVDGFKYGEVRQSDTPKGGTWPFESNRYRGQLNLAIGGNWPGSSNQSTPDEVIMYIDSFRVLNAY